MGLRVQQMDGQTMGSGLRDRRIDGQVDEWRLIMVMVVYVDGKTSVYGSGV